MKRRSHWNRVDSNPMTGVLIGRGNSGHTHRHTGKMSCGEQDRDWNDRSTSQGMSNIAGNHQKLERGKEGFFPKNFRETTALLIP